MFKSSLTIAIPLYNEEASIIYLKSRLDLLLADSNNINLKILFVDDGSTDNTFELLTKYFSSLNNCNIIKHENNKPIMKPILEHRGKNKGNIKYFLSSLSNIKPIATIEYKEV